MLDLVLLQARQLAGLPPRAVEVTDVEVDLPHHLAAAALLITDRGGRVLMVATDYRDTLVLPGGIIEPDEPPGGGRGTRGAGRDRPVPPSREIARGAAHPAAATAGIRAAVRLRHRSG